MGITPASTIMLWLELVNAKFARTPPAASFTFMSSSSRDLMSNGTISLFAIFTRSFSSTDKFHKVHMLCSFTYGNKFISTSIFQHQKSCGENFKCNFQYLRCQARLTKQTSYLFYCSRFGYHISV